MPKSDYYKTYMQNVIDSSRAELKNLLVELFTKYPEIYSKGVLGALTIPPIETDVAKIQGAASALDLMQVLNESGYSVDELAKALGRRIRIDHGRIQA